MMLKENTLYDVIGVGVSTVDLIHVVEELPGGELVQKAFQTALQGGGAVATAMVTLATGQLAFFQAGIIIQAVLLVAYAAFDVFFVLRTAIGSFRRFSALIFFILACFFIFIFASVLVFIFACVLILIFIFTGATGFVQCRRTG